MRKLNGGVPQEKAPRQTHQVVNQSQYPTVQNLLAVGMGGVSPRASTLLEAALLPIIALACRAFLWHADACAARYPARKAEEIFGEDGVGGKEKDQMGTGVILQHPH